MNVRFNQPVNNTNASSVFCPIRDTIMNMHRSVLPTSIPPLLDAYLNYWLTAQTRPLIMSDVSGSIRFADFRTTVGSVYQIVLEKECCNVRPMNCASMCCFVKSLWYGSCPKGIS